MLARSLRHLKWADSAYLDALCALPEDALQATYAPDSRTVAEILLHIVDGAEWYRYCLNGTQWTGLRPPASWAEVASLRLHLADLDATLLAESEDADATMTFDDEDGPRTALRSTLLTQAVLHSIEHRAQIACALAASGFDGPSLDDLDMWAFEAAEG